MTSGGRRTEVKASCCSLIASRFMPSSMMEASRCCIKDKTVMLDSAEGFRLRLATITMKRSNLTFSIR